MSNFLGLTVTEGQKEERRVVNGKVVKFKYPEVVADHYRYRGAVENCNTLRHDGEEKAQIVLESAWVTTWWSIQVFTFFIACTKVNAYMAMKYLLNMDDGFMNLQNELDKTFINNSYMIDKSTREQKKCHIYWITQPHMILTMTKKGLHSKI